MDKKYGQYEDREDYADDSSSDVVIEAMAQLQEPKSVKTEPDDNSCQEAPIVDPLFGATDQLDKEEEEEKSARLASNLVEAIVKADISDREVETEYLESSGDDYFGPETDSSDSDWEERPSPNKKATKRRKVTPKRTKKKKMKTTKGRPPKKEVLKTVAKPIKSTTKNSDTRENGIVAWVRRYFPKLSEKLGDWRENGSMIVPQIVSTDDLVGKNLTCFVCGRRCKDSKVLKDHINDHPKRKLSACSTCGKITFNNHCDFGHPVI